MKSSIESTLDWYKSLKATYRALVIAAVVLFLWAVFGPIIIAVSS
jgi:hypothetical protein